MKFEFPVRFRSRVQSIDSASINDNLGHSLGWSSIVIDDLGRSIGGGTSETRDAATRIAIAESLEKLEMQYGFSESEQELIQIKRFPTRCGLAVGFEKRPTLLRSLAEGIERWVWSKWIDDGYRITKINKPTLNPLANFYFNKFSKVIFFEMNVLHENRDIHSPLKFGATIGFSENGAFPGSRVCSLQEDPWTHSLIESWRNYQVFKNLSDRTDVYPFLRERLELFGNNAERALKTIEACQKSLWPKPELEFMVPIEREADGYFLVRSIFKDYIPWHEGAASRFIL